MLGIVEYVLVVAVLFMTAIEQLEKVYRFVDVEKGLKTGDIM